ncbi:MAG: hypothetical protein AAFV88_06200 [Planctomycetota bacterium]
MPSSKLTIESVHGFKETVTVTPTGLVPTTANDATKPSLQQPKSSAGTGSNTR